MTQILGMLCIILGVALSMDKQSESGSNNSPFLRFRERDSDPQILPISQPKTDHLQLVPLEKEAEDASRDLITKPEMDVVPARKEVGPARLSLPTQERDEILGRGFDTFTANPISVNQERSTKSRILARGYRSRVLAINSEQVTNPPKIKKLSERAQAYRISDMASYKDSLQRNFGGSVSAFGAEFALNTGWGETVSKLQRSNQVMVKVSRRYNYRDATLDLHRQDIQLDPAFMKHIVSLPLQYNYEAYLEVIQRFGTAVVKGVTYGGEYTREMTMSTSDYQKMGGESFNWGVSLGGNVMGSGGKLNGGSKSDQENKQAWQKIVKKNSLIAIGGTTVANQDAWYDSLRKSEDYGVVYTDVYLITNFITGRYFHSYISASSDDPTREARALEIGQKRTNLIRAMCEYCGKLAKQFGVPIPPSHNGMCIKSGYEDPWEKAIVWSFMPILWDANLKQQIKRWAGYIETEIGGSSMAIEAPNPLPSRRKRLGVPYLGRGITQLELKEDEYWTVADIEQMLSASSTWQIRRIDES